MRAGHISHLLRRSLLIVAHPDDESVGAGVLLQRIQDPCVVFCTDGGPRDSYFWQSYGGRENYVTVRGQETETAMRIAGVKRTAFLNFCDQELHRNLRSALNELNELAREFRPDALLTHAYEGGHPDHDSCAFLAYLLGSQQRIPVWEMPLYHRTGEGIRRQQFLQPTNDTALLRGTAGELDTKRNMVRAHASQSQALKGFDLKCERFRPQASYDFWNPPKAEVINYEAWRWPLTAEQVCAAFATLLPKIQA